jgi:hypothetical protein
VPETIDTAARQESAAPIADIQRKLLAKNIGIIASLEREKYGFSSLTLHGSEDGYTERIPTKDDQASDLLNELYRQHGAIPQSNRGFTLKAKPGTPHRLERWKYVRLASGLTAIELQSEQEEWSSFCVRICTSEALFGPMRDYMMMEGASSRPRLQPRQEQAKGSSQGVVPVERILAAVHRTTMDDGLLISGQPQRHQAA